MFLLILILTLPLLHRLVMDYYTIKIKKVEVNHLKHSLITGVNIIICTIIVYELYKFPLWKSIILSIAIFNLLFDYSLNIMRGLKWYYIDKGLDGKQSLADKFYYKIGIQAVLFMKVFIMLLVLGFCFMN